MVVENYIGHSADETGIDLDFVGGTRVFDDSAKGRRATDTLRLSSTRVYRCRLGVDALSAG